MAGRAVPGAPRGGVRRRRWRRRQADQDEDRLQVLASFYPLQYVAQRVAGERASVRSLTEPGAEPHDVELTPRDVAVHR